MGKNKQNYQPQLVNAGFLSIKQPGFHPKSTSAGFLFVAPLCRLEVHDVGLPVGGNVAGTHDMAVGDDAAVEVGVQAW